MTAPKVFEVTAIEYFETKEGTDPVDPKVHLWKKARIGTDSESVKFQVQHELAGRTSGDGIAAFFNRLEVKVDVVNFP